MLTKPLFVFLIIIGATCIGHTQTVTGRNATFVEYSNGAVNPAGRFTEISP